MPTEVRGDAMTAAAYDRLTAAQIVAFLAELDDDGLEEVAQLEAAGKGRVTVLRKVDALLARRSQDAGPMTAERAAATAVPDPPAPSAEARPSPAVRPRLGAPPLAVPSPLAVPPALAVPPPWSPPDAAPPWTGAPQFRGAPTPAPFRRRFGQVLAIRVLCSLCVLVFAYGVRLAIEYHPWSGGDTSASSRYVSDLEEGAPGLAAAIGQPAELRLGGDACAHLDQGVSVPGAAVDVIGDSGYPAITPRDDAQVVANAVTYLCPDHLPELNAFLTSPQGGTQTG